MLRRAVCALALAAGVFSAPSHAQVGCLATTGVFTGLAEQIALNAAFHALISTNAGATAPVTDCSGVSLPGQLWYDTSDTYKAIRFFEGTTWPAFGFQDTTNHIWMPNVGGGVGTKASASTVDLCASAPWSFITISGTTTITSFGSTCPIGVAKFLSFSGVLSITSGGSMLLPTGATITTQAGDQAIALHTGGGVWRIIQYLRADGSALTLQVIPQAFVTGEIRLMAVTSCPATTLYAAGGAFSRTTYAALFAAIGTTYGAGDGSTTFNVPDLRGVVVRGLDDGKGYDTGRAMGSYQADQLQDHVHTITTVVVGLNTFFGYQVGGGGNAINSGSFAAPTMGNPTTGNHGAETRVKNVAMKYCIAF